MKAKYCPSTQKRYNQQKADQEAKDAAIKALQDAIDKGAKALPSAYASNVSMDLAFKKHNGTQDNIIDLASSKVSFDVDVSGLKAGNKIHIANISLSSPDAPDWDGNNDLMYISLSGNPRVIINGVDYGCLEVSNAGNGQNGGDQGSRDGRRDTTDRASHEMFFVLQKDYQGIGKQYVEVKLSNGSVNFEVGPSSFDNKPLIHVAMKVTDHSGKVINQDNLTLTKPSGQEPADGRHNGLDMNTGNQSTGFTPGIYWSQALGGDSVLNINSKLNNQNSYIIATKISSSASFLGFAGKNPSGHVDLSWVTFGSDGNSRPMNRAVDASNLDNNKVFIQVEKDGLSEEQLENEIDKSKTYGLASKQADGSYEIVTNIAKSWMQERVKKALGTSDSILTKYGAWQIERDSDPQKALQNTLNFYKQNDYLPTGITIWSPELYYVDPNSQGTTTVSVHSIGLSAPYSFSDTESIAKPTPSALIYGQSGIRVHYIDGTTGKDLRQISNSIGDPNKTTSVIPEEIAGYNLTAEGAKGIPTGAKTVESTTQVSYPKDGTWKDVYIVYMPYLPTGKTTAHYHYDVFGICGRHEQWPSFKFNFAT